MALVVCKDCGNQVSTDADKCPKCGAKMPKKTSRTTWLFGGALALLIGSCIHGMDGAREDAAQRQAQKVAAEAAKSPEQRAKEAAAKAKEEAEFQFVVSVARGVKSSMKDPSSFELMNAGVTDAGTACLVYRGKNAFAAITTEQVAVGKDGKKVTWNGNCGGKKAADYSHARQAL